MIDDHDFQARKRQIDEDHETLKEVSATVARTEGKVDDIITGQATQTNWRTDIEEKLVKIDPMHEAIHGAVSQNKPGLLVRVERLEGRQLQVAGGITLLGTLAAAGAWFHSNFWPFGK